jgi:hypothetical protein
MARESSGRSAMSVRLPEDLHGELKAQSATTGVAMNELVVRAVAQLLERPDLATLTSGSDISSQIARDSIRMDGSAIGPLKGIAKHCVNRGQTALGGVLYAAAAREVLHEDGPQRAAEELSHTAAVMESSNHFELAVGLWQEAVALDTNNLTAVNRLGQRLHHLAQRAGDDIGRYREAERHLARVTFVDNYAKLFHGWSRLFVARADGDVDAEQLGRTEVVDALKHWAFGQRDGNSRRGWIRQVRRLYDTGYEAAAEELRDFANRNADWGAIDSSELQDGSPSPAATEPPEARDVENTQIFDKGGQ